MKMKYIKKFNEHITTISEPPVKPPRRRNGGGGDGDGDESFYYYEEWLRYFTTQNYPERFHEIWRDEAYRKKLKNNKDTDSFKFYSKLWYEHMDDHEMFKYDIENSIRKYIIDYNNEVREADRKKDLEKEIEDIQNSHEIEFDGVTVHYKLEKPDVILVGKLIKHGESEESANMPLLSIEEIDFEESAPNKEEDLDYTKTDRWVKTVYNPFLKKHIEPWAESNGWRLWKY